MKTTNYDMFNYMKTNRSINNGLVNRIIKSINDIGYISSRPIIVDSNMTIIDGQHRFEACKELSLPIYYEIENVDLNKAMIALNMNQQIWRLNEYIESYANSGIECYQKLRDFEKQYKLTNTNAIIIFVNTGNANNKLTKTIQSGSEFNINNRAHETAQFIQNCRSYFSFSTTKPFVSSITALFKRTSIENCEKVFDKIQSLRQQATVTDYLFIYENIINRYKKDSDKVILRNN